MRERANYNTGNAGLTLPRMLDLTELCHYIGLGRNGAASFGERTGAKRKIGRRTLYDRNIIDSALDSLTPKE